MENANYDDKCRLNDPRDLNELAVVGCPEFKYTVLSDTFFQKQVEISLQEMVAQKTYLCVTTLKAESFKDYRIGTYEQMCSAKTTKQLGDDLKTFIAEQQQAQSSRMSFVAAFRGPVIFTEFAFENHIREQIGKLNQMSKDAYWWDSRLSNDPKTMEFCFSFAGHSFLIVGMHPNSSRKSRVFLYPMLVFNLRSQFELLNTQIVCEPIKSGVGVECKCPLKH